MIRAFARLVFINLRRHKIRSVISIAGISFGVAAMLAVVSIVLGAIGMFQNILANESQYVVFEKDVSDLFFSSVTMEQIEELRKMPMLDRVDPMLVDQVEAALSGVNGVEKVEEVRIRWIGHELRAEAIIVSDGRLPLSEAHAIAEQARHRLLHEVPRLTEALIHSDPALNGQVTGHDLTAHHFTPQP